VTLDLKPEIAAALETLASAQGLSVEDYLERLVEKELPLKPEDASRQEGSGMVWENGLYVYRTGRPLPCFQKRAGIAKGDGLLKFLRNAPDTPPEPEDRIT
jgi:hypothetical protein